MNSIALPRVIVALATIAGLVGALYLGRAVGQFQIQQLITVFVLFFGGFFMLIVGKEYWVFVPLAFVLDVPGLPFLASKNISLPELATAAAFAVLLARTAFKAETFVVARTEIFPVYLYFAWAAMIYCLNPVGLQVLGAESVGGRFYVQLLLGLLAFLVVVRSEVDEKHARWIILIMIFGTIVGKVFEIYNFIKGTAVERGLDLESSSYTWHQSLVGPAAIIAVWIFCRFKPSQIFHPSRWYIFALYLGCLYMAMQSGKRAGFAGVVLIPFISGFLHKQYAFSFVYSVLAALAISTMVIGHGQMFDLPIRAQRVLMNLPGDWDPEIKGYTTESADDFRQALRDIAYKKIGENPIFGKGVGIDTTQVSGLFGNATSTNEMAIQMLAVGSSWHSTWVGIAADFGLPACLFWAWFWVMVLIVCFKLKQLLPYQSSRWVLAMMIFVGFFQRIITSWTSGHSTNSPFDQWWLYGLLLALLYTFNSEQKAAQRAQQAADQNPALALAPSLFKKSRQDSQIAIPEASPNNFAKRI